MVATLALLGVGFWVPGMITTRGCLARLYECDAAAGERCSGRVGRPGWVMER
jgi:hypothetical protein